MSVPEHDEREAAEQLGELDAELGPEGDAFEDPDLNDSNDWEFLP